MGKRIIEKKTVFVTRDRIEAEKDEDKGLFGGSADMIAIWQSDKKPELDADGNWGMDKVDASMQDMGCDTTEELAKAFGVKFEKGVCIKVQLEIDRRERPKDVLAVALRSNSIRTKNTAIKAAIAVIEEDD